MSLVLPVTTYHWFWPIRAGCTDIVIERFNNALQEIQGTGNPEKLLTHGAEPEWRLQPGRSMRLYDANTTNGGMNKMRGFHKECDLPGIE